jgi:hypothetical protein
VLGTLQYSVVYNNSPPPSPPPPSKRPHCPLWPRLSQAPLVPVFLGNPVSLRFRASCRSSSDVPVPLGLFFRRLSVISRPSVESSRRLRAHPCHPRKTQLPRDPLRIANCRRQNRPFRRRFFAPAGLFSHPLSWRQSSFRIGATPIAPGRSSLGLVLVRLADAKRRLAMLWNGDFGSANNLGNHWSDLEVTPICRLVRRISVGLQVGLSEEAEHSRR